MNIQSITSAQNPRLKQAHKLRRRRGRDQTNRILIDGQRAIRCAVDAGVKLDSVFVCEPRLQESEQSLLQACVDAGAEILSLSPSFLSKISYGGRDDQWVATAESPNRSLDSLKLPEKPFVAVLDRVEKPGNLGAVLRSADAAGVHAVVLSDGMTDVYNPNAIRASLGTVFSMPICEATTAETIHWLSQYELTVFVARVDGAVDYTQAELGGGAAVVFGNEAEGVAPVWLEDRWKGIRLPMCGAADSLNVSATAAVVFYEANRQRTIGD